MVRTIFAHVLYELGHFMYLSYNNLMRWSLVVQGQTKRGPWYDNEQVDEFFNEVD